MTALRGLRENIYALRQAHAQGDGERVWRLLDDLEDDLDVAEREGSGARRFVDHCCVGCESDCATVTDLKRRARLLGMDVQRLAFALVEARELRDFAESEIERRFPRRTA